MLLAYPASRLDALGFHQVPYVLPPQRHDPTAALIVGSQGAVVVAGLAEPDVMDGNSTESMAVSAIR
jgi:hypothetical protein